MAYPAEAQNGLGLETDTLARTVRVHPVIDTDKDGLDLWSREHEYQPELGQWGQLARDFLVARAGRDGITRPYREAPGANITKTGSGGGEMSLRRSAGPSLGFSVPTRRTHRARKGKVTVLYGHVREIEVEEGQRVEAGEVVAKVGNNGNSTAPHIHVGAWTNGTPLQIQVVLHAGAAEGPATK